MPNADQSSAATTSGCGIEPRIGTSVMSAESRTSTGRKAISVITESSRLTPSRSVIVAKRMVSSCTRCEAPSMCRSRGQWYM